MRRKEESKRGAASRKESEELSPLSFSEKRPEIWMEMLVFTYTRTRLTLPPSLSIRLRWRWVRQAVSLTLGKLAPGP